MTPLTWPAYEDVIIKTYEIKGETDKVCNKTDSTADFAI